MNERERNSHNKFAGVPYASFIKEQFKMNIT